MNEAFEKCIKKRKIIPFPRAKGFVKKELEAVKDDLEEARDRLINDRYKYATINSYYSIFHAARVLLYSKGYRERRHHCLSAAIEALYVKTGKMNSRFIRIFSNSMSLRENADYSGIFSKESAIVSVSNAEEFLNIAMILLK